MPTIPIWFEDVQEMREVEPARWRPGKELRSGGVVVDRAGSTPIFEIPGYNVLMDDVGRLVARRI